MKDTFYIPDLQQKALPFFPPYVWREGYCGRCGDSTFLDDKYPVGWCEACVESEELEMDKYDDDYDYKEKRKETLMYFLEKFPDWKY